MKPFQFSLNDHVRLGGGKEVGNVIARAEYSNAINRYLVRYVAGDGRLVETWWDEDALTVVSAIG